MSLGVTSLLSPVSDHRVRAIIDTLAAAGRDVIFIDGPWQERFDAMRDGTAVAGWLCGLLHVELTAAGGWNHHAVAAPSSPRAGSTGDPVYFGDVVVSSRSDIREFSDLRGARFAYNEESSLSGYRMMLDLLALHDADLSFFTTSRASGSHLESMRLVAAGEADCAIIDSTLIDDRVEGTDTVRTVVSVGPYPAPPLVTAPGHEEPFRSVAATSGWSPVDEASYATLRRP